MAEHSQLTGNGASSKKRAQVQSWLTEEGYAISEAQDSGAYWILVGTGRYNSVVVASPKQNPDRLEIQAGVTIDENSRREFMALPSAERKAFLWELRFGLLGFRIEFTGLVEPLEQVNIAQSIYDDGLTKDAFCQRVVDVKRATFFILFMVGRKFNHVIEDQGGMFIH